MIILDTETTGLVLPSAAALATQPRIIDLAAIKIDARTGEEVARFHTLLDPQTPLDADIQRITGYRDSDLVGAPVFVTVLAKLQRFFLGEWSVLAHNWPFDKAMLQHELERCDSALAFPWPPLQLCTVQLYSAEFVKNPKLTELYAAKCGRKLEQRHTAMADAEALLEIVRAERLHELGDH